MDISKPQFIDDMAIGSCQKDKFNQIYNEAFSRNKLNHEQIIAFEAKKDEYEAKLKAFKEMMKL